MAPGFFFDLPGARGVVAQDLIAEPLTAAAFAPFGRMVAAGPEPTRSVNVGTADRLDQHGHFAHRTDTGLPTLAIYRCRPQPVPVAVPLLERHPLTTQTFLPLRVARWLFVVAPARSDGLPAPLSARACAAERVALLPFELINTSLEPTRADETARLVAFNEVAAERLTAAGYAMVDPAPVAGQLAGISSLRGCNGCELALGRELGADYVTVGWVQKVSNLILNVNLAVRAVASGRSVAAGTVDIRGNTDESWRRGVLYLLDHRILPRKLSALQRRSERRSSRRQSRKARSRLIA
jgi:hypothetical protein